FIQNVIDFLIVALSIFVVLRAFTKLQNRRKKAEEHEEEKKDA
ncbi:MAG: MscL family protein, partial [Clostridia bacterium]|nr:MscL family protein [Clostridia bacterium]